MNLKTTQWWIFANPISGGFNARRLNELNSCLYRDGILAAVRLPASQQQLIEQVRDLWRLGERNFIVAAGDGTASVLINAILEFGSIEQARLAIFPMGSGNDTARSLGKHKYRDRDIAGWARALDSDCFKPISLLKITTEHEVKFALNIWGVGLDAQVLAARRTGSYLLSLLKALVNAKTINIGQQAHHEDLYTLLCANGRYAGGGMIFTPSAKLCTSTMHVFKLAKTSLLGLIPWIPYLYNGKINRHPKVSIDEVTTVQFSLSQPTLWQCDGELQQPSCEFRCELQEAAISLYYPHTS